ncbi:MAG: helix-turn-helix transcriptional regulator [Clostridia bacterium]|nr:helix-turn-helix transcriptional regulator [Clostridia bacterium]
MSIAIGYNSSYLSRYFKEFTNMTFVSCVNRYRISRACYMLKNSDKTVLECAYECGYKSLRSFNRNFMLYVGVTPTDYRTN